MMAVISVRIWPCHLATKLRSKSFSRWTMEIIVYTYVSDSNHHVPSSGCLSPIRQDRSSLRWYHTCSGQSCRDVACR